MFRFALTIVLGCVGMLTASALELSRTPAKSIAVVDTPQQATFRVEGSSKGSADPLFVEAITPDGGRVALGKLVPPTFQLTTAWTPAQTGFYQFCLVAEPGGAPQARAGEQAVLKAPLEIFYWRAPKATQWLTRRLCRPGEAEYWAGERGVSPALWAPGITKRHSKEPWSAEAFLQRWSQPLPPEFESLVIDEFSGKDNLPITQAMTEALRGLREHIGEQQHVGIFTIRLDPTADEVRAMAEVADTIMVEGYITHSGSAARFEQYWQAIQAAQIEEKALIAIWLGRVITTRQDLSRQLAEIRRIAPSLRGIAINGSATPEFFAEVDDVIKDYFIKPVLTLESRQGQWICRNIGWMTAYNVPYRSRGALHRLKQLAPGATAILGSGEAPQPVAGEGYTWLDALPAEESSKAPSAPLDSQLDLLREEGREESFTLRLPLTPLTPLAPPYAIEAVVDISKFGNYGVVAFGLGQQRADAYDNRFFAAFPKRWQPAARLEAMLYRGDLERKGERKTSGARLRFGFETTEAFIRSEPDFTVLPGTMCRIRIDVREDAVSLAIEESGQNRRWHSGDLKIATAQCFFDEAYLRVRRTAGSTLRRENTPAILLGSGGGESEKEVAAVRLKEWRILTPTRP